MEITVKSKYLKISPRKLRLAVNLIRGINLERARNILFLSNNKGSRILKSLVDSAIASVKESNLEINKFFVKTIVCSDGPRLKRGKPASKGSMMAIKKRQSHVVLTISDNIVSASSPAKSKKRVENKKENVKEINPEEKKDK
jgi:large subunit ribosomal protein L22